MACFSELGDAVPAGMLESVENAFSAVFGNTLTEGALLESQREIDRMTRDNIYKAMAANYMGGYPNDWNTPQARMMFERMHEAFNRLATDFYGEVSRQARSRGMDIPEQTEGMFRNRNDRELTVLQLTLNGIRSAMQVFDDARKKYMPGISRIAVLFPNRGGCGFNSQFQDSRRIKLFKAFIDFAVDVCPDPEAEGAEFDVDFNGMTLDELMARYGNAVRDEIRSAHDRVHGYTADPAKRGNYRIVKIGSYDEARPYARYARWCICENRVFWDTYSLEGDNTVYFCLREGFEDEPRVAGENSPLDSYGLSMMCIIVDRDGDLATSTTRWNDANGGTDWAITPEQIVDLVGRPFGDAFPASPEVPEYVTRARSFAGQV